MGAHAIRAFAPGGIGNIGPGLDILGCAITGPGDSVVAILRDEPGIVVTDPGHPELPADPSENAAAIAAGEVLRLAGRERTGLTLRIQKGLPLAGGQGGSAASAVAGAVAANALLGSPLDSSGLLQAAFVAESRIAGRHADNLAPALLGGIVLVHGMDPLDIIRLPVPAELRVVLAYPAQRLATASARAVLPRMVDREVAIRQAAHVALMIVAFSTGDLSLLKRAVRDEIAEPARAPLLPGFVEARRAALDAGALGVSISGAGPTSFAFADSDDDAREIAAAMIEGYRTANVVASARIERIDEQGAHAEPVALDTPAVRR